MEAEAISFYNDHLEQLIRLTDQERIKWTQQNPSSYFWESDASAGSFITSIQKVSATDSFTFQIIESDTKEVVLTLSGPSNLPSKYVDGWRAIRESIKSLQPKTEDTQTGGLLSDLYVAIEATVHARSKSIFKELIDKASISK